ncbi:MAG: DEAD/DEAH box helicase [Euryarchaeota archaeon]|nr:DEAD/DEAH box helicase [Euryarchaeota archaeon]
MAPKQSRLGEFYQSAKGHPSPAAPADAPFKIVDGHVSHPMIRAGAVEAREYQVAIAARAIRENLLVVLPTGLGKTVVAALVIADAIIKSSGGKVLFLSPTRPLAQQHKDSMLALMKETPTSLFTGSVPAQERKDLWDASRIVLATPQTVRNDLEAGLYTLDDCVLVIFDEAHRAAGAYAYVDVAARALSVPEPPRLLGITASPGSSRAKIENVMAALGLTSAEIRTEADADVAPYVATIDAGIVRVELPGYMKRLATHFDATLRERVKRLQARGFVPPKPPEYVGKGDLIKAGNALRAAIGRGNKTLFPLLQDQTIGVHAAHCLELLETQGTLPLTDYLDRMAKKEKPARSEATFLNDPRIVEARRSLQDFPSTSHPKMSALLEIVKAQLAESTSSKVIVFVQYRDTIRVIMEMLDAMHISATRFVGQASRNEGDEGLSQERQREILDEFRTGGFNVLVASSVAEEGLDIPAVDLVVFYEPVASEIRTIQRRGRTGRGRIGRIVVLVATGTRDEAFLRIEAKREERMGKIVRKMSRGPPRG